MQVGVSDLRMNWQECYKWSGFVGGCCGFVLCFLGLQLVLFGCLGLLVKLRFSDGSFVFYELCFVRWLFDCFVCALAGIGFVSLV